ncbi:putative SnoaL-like aldol condensation-catalyzing enzyme [Sphingopyxis panaciterrae]|uniref:nuclear transport factor 2 family protein n=1 Tax=Sphingopyxis panaciterrae TaxID=363841 RepID=UPI00141DCED6|nr:nuclear transport factor 2 family protein [Sphingopyxis panaciterrae]NIJ38837.1 putative SnoaL-like aldol condensation-catalyzing enzyme [Sphingopyxis panaciterrae]
MSAQAGLAAWHAYMTGGGDPQALKELLAADAVFHSPVVHTPQEGRDKVFAYLHAASHVLGGQSFRYLREIADGDQAMLEFASELDGIQINGVDIIRWDDEGKIKDFKVMVRPLKAINKVWEKMAAMLAAQAG